MGYFEDQESEWCFFIVSDFYFLVLISIILIHVYYLSLGYGATGGVRKLYLPDEYLQKEFGQEHMQATGKPIPTGGYPDMGSGRYVKRAGYKAWYEFNKAVRIHLNYGEWIM